MESETTSSAASIFFKNVNQTLRRYARFLGRVFKPGGWRYLRPTATDESQPTDARETHREHGADAERRRRAA